MKMRLSLLAGLLTLLMGSLMAVTGQPPAPPRGDPDAPPPPRQPAPGQVPRGAPERGQPAAPHGEDVDEFFRDHDRDGDGALTPEELPPSLRQRFKNVDTNRDGKISRRELQQGLMHMAPQSRPSDVIFAVVEMSDSDPRNGQEVQRMYDILRRLDRNQDGKIDQAELRSARQQIIKDRIDFLFNDLDANKDGRISKAEARGQLRQDFNRLDANGDGYLDRQEIQRASTAPPPQQPRGGEQPGRLPPRGGDPEAAPPPGAERVPTPPRGRVQPEDDVPPPPASPRRIPRRTPDLPPPPQ